MIQVPAHHARWRQHLLALSKQERVPARQSAVWRPDISIKRVPLRLTPSAWHAVQIAPHVRAPGHRARRAIPGISWTRARVPRASWIVPPRVVPSRLHVGAQATPHVDYALRATMMTPAAACLAQRKALWRLRSRLDQRLVRALWAKRPVSSFKRAARMPMRCAPRVLQTVWRVPEPARRVSHAHQGGSSTTEFVYRRQRRRH